MVRRQAATLQGIQAILALTRLFPFPSPVSDRLSELQRQRALAQEQLAWLDREIAKERGQAATVPAVPAPVVPAAVPAAIPAATPDNRVALDAATAREADQIIAEYQKGPSTAGSDTRKGCWLWFLAALALFGIAVTAIFLVYGAR